MANFLKLKNRSTLMLFFLMVSMIIIIPACGDDEPDDPDTCETENLTYSNFAGDLLDDNCATSGCHNEDALANGAPGRLDDYEQAKMYMDNFGARVIGAINHNDGFSNMPKGQEQLSDCNISKLTAWINDGAPE